MDISLITLIEHTIFGHYQSIIYDKAKDKIWINIKAKQTITDGH